MKIFKNHIKKSNSFYYIVSFSNSFYYVPIYCRRKNLKDKEGLVLTKKLITNNK